MKRSLLVLFFAFGVLGTSARAGLDRDAYFVEVYGYENWRNAAAFSHTFASFYKVEPSGQITRVDISWIPRDDHMRGLRPLRMPAFGDHPGQNLALEDTLGRAAAAGRRVTRFGPFASSQELFDRAVTQVTLLRSGAVTYRGLDRRTRPVSMNCVHAVTSMIGEFYTGLSRGPDASWGVAEFFHRSGFLPSLEAREDWFPFLHGRATWVPSPPPMRIYH